MKKISLLSSLLLLTSICVHGSEQQHTFQQRTTCVSSNINCWPTQEEWHELNNLVNGNLVSVVPPGKACYSGKDFNKNTCRTYQKGFLSDLHRESYIGTMQNINWETCGEEGGCLLNSLFPSLPQFFGKCSQGALPRYALNSTSEQEIATVIGFAQRHGIAFNIKNSGHDFLGRSTSPDSITIWTHPLQKIEFHTSFQPQDCQDVPPQKAFTFGGGVKWFDAYRAADEHNVTVVGGAQAGVGVAGGWLGGGGHSMLTPAFGLGVDHVLQYKVILASGELVTVNKCHYPDLFWALRGGGGGTFGVVTEVTMRVHPKINLQAIGVELFITVPGAQKLLMLEFARHSERWAEEGWGGYFYYYGTGIKFLYGNPLLSKEEAEISMKPFLDFVNSKPWTYLKKRIETGTSDGFYEFFINIMHPNAEMVGYGARIASRLIPRSHFATNETIEQLIDKFIEGTKLTRPGSFFVPTQILATTSLREQDKDGETSVQPLFRSSVWHVIYTGGWIQGMPEFIKRRTSIKVSQAADPIRDITPNGGAYFNEADILEPKWRQSFWGDDNYDRLVIIKQKYDPNNFFNCWKCIGWDESMAIKDKKYRCYQY
ncbi:hypothetical protein BDF21DRAFT_468414 [Thamnidium elegans]|uniref:FAD-binding PCMH-type domain-containing protein n=1 Tax=Thamnidium elegans TaxID=101142 RepID=A0A8H7SL64_9FUNG|nr:hypothetical protein INT48_008795 [Thamnidium elegans]KAI8052691.1 hypothetical protein BDF21DRAFT_468414 [Thamnidium elegans]